MKRNMDAVRSILLQIEAETKPFTWIKLAVPDCSEEEVSYHVKIMSQAGLIEAMDTSSHDGISWKPMSLTWQGHEFLDAARNDDRWANAKKLVMEKGLGMTISVLGEVLKQLATKAAIGIHPLPLSH